MALDLGLHVIERSVEEMMPTSLFDRPILNTIDYVKALVTYSHSGMYTFIHIVTIVRHRLFIYVLMVYS